MKYCKILLHLKINIELFYAFQIEIPCKAPLLHFRITGSSRNHSKMLICCKKHF